jgi:hypothetical protein
MRLLAVLLSAALVAGVAPAAALAITITGNRPLEVAERFSSELDPQAEALSTQAKAGIDSSDSEAAASYTTPLVRVEAPLPTPKPTTTAISRTVRVGGTSASSSPRASSKASGSSGSSATKNSGTPAAPAKPAPAPKPKASGDTLSRARAILNARIASYPILRGASVEVGDTKGNGQAICYYKSGRIIINANHTASLERIIDHEIWHIIDWRDNGQINWGESVPPSNAASFRG